MKLKFLDTRSIRDSDSDYETAVDISHWSLNSNEYFFETDNGLKLVFSFSEERTTHSYLEPDFDNISEDHKGPLPYAVHRDNSNDKIINQKNILAILVEEKKSYTLDDFKKILTKQSSSFEFEENEALNSLEFGYNYGANVSHLNVSKQELEQFEFFLENQKIIAGKEYDFNFSKTVLEQIRELENINKKNIEKNFKIDESNQNNKNEAELQTTRQNRVLDKELLDSIVYGFDTSDNAKKIIELLDSGASLSLLNDIGDNALMVACRKNMKGLSRAVFDYLFELTPNHILNNIRFDINAANFSGETILNILIKRGDNYLIESVLTREHEGIKVSPYVCNMDGIGNLLNTAKRFNNEQSYELIMNYLTKEQDKISNIIAKPKI